MFQKILTYHNALNAITFTDVHRIHTKGVQQGSSVSFIKVH